MLRPYDISRERNEIVDFWPRRRGAGGPSEPRAEAKAASAGLGRRLLPLLGAAVRVVLGLHAALAQLHHQRSEVGDAGLDAGAGVVVQVLALEQALELFHRIE